MDTGYGDQRLILTSKKITGKKVFPEGKIDRKFKTRIEVSAAMIGKIDSIGLDRSSRIGGDALFDNLVVEIPKP